MTDPLACYAGLVSPDYRMFEIRDYDFDPEPRIFEALDGAIREVAGSNGRIIIVSTADEVVPCHLTIAVHRQPPAPADACWRGRLLLPLHSTSGRIVVSQVSKGVADAFSCVDLHAGPGDYTAAVHHQGRQDLRERAPTVRRQDLDTDEEYVALMDLAGIERYLLQIWPTS